MRALLLALLLAFPLVGCGNEETAPPQTSTQQPPIVKDIRVYWLRDGKVWPVQRTIGVVGPVEPYALDELRLGQPTEQERGDLDLTSAIPTGLDPPELVVANGVAGVDLGSELSEEALAQIVYTLTQFPTIESVEVNGQSYTRADFEDQTPSVLVESPLPFEDVESPLRVTGTANTFEATFSYELTDTDGRIVDENFVTATSGTGTRGTFDFTTKPVDSVGSLIVFELSAKDGSRINLVEIPLRMTR